MAVVRIMADGRWYMAAQHTSSHLVAL